MKQYDELPEKASYQQCISILNLVIPQTLYICFPNDDIFGGRSRQSWLGIFAQSFAVAVLAAQFDCCSRSRDRSSIYVHILEVLPPIDTFTSSSPTAIPFHIYSGTFLTYFLSLSPPSYVRTFVHSKKRHKSFFAYFIHDLLLLYYLVIYHCQTYLFLSIPL